jgi:hypothetical protein
MAKLTKDKLQEIIKEELMRSQHNIAVTVRLSIFVDTDDIPDRDKALAEVEEAVRFHIGTLEDGDGFDGISYEIEAE